MFIRRPLTSLRLLTRLRRAVFAALPAAYLLSSAAPAGAIYIRNDISVSGYNAIAGKAAFAPTGYVADTSWGQAFSSGTLITPTKVLTAAHVVDENGDLKVDDPAGLNHLVFGLGKYVPQNLMANVASVAINPAYKGGNAAYDLAILTLKKPITSIAGAKLSSNNAVGYRGAMVGYGYQGTGLRDGLTGAADKLAAYNAISTIQNGTYLTDFDSPSKNKSTFGSPTPLTYEGTTAPGDSGGPLYGDFGNDIWRIVGILNGGYNDKGPDSHYGDISVYAALNDPKNTSFLKSQGFVFTAGNPASSGTFAASVINTRTAPVPEPASLALLGVMSGLMMRRRRGPRSALK